MSPDWAGWIVLHAMLFTAFVAGGICLVAVGIRVGARWLLRRWFARW